MNPAFSVIVLTTLTGAAQGLAIVLALAHLGGTSWLGEFHRSALSVAIIASLIGLAASFFHLGRPERAWRAVMMWRTSWLSREVIVLPVFIACLMLWWWLGADSAWNTVMAALAIALAITLWWCTGMIYACLKFIQEWASGYTIAQFSASGIAAGLTWAACLRSINSTDSADQTFQQGLSQGSHTLIGAAIAAGILAWIIRAMSLKRNRGLVHKSTLQSATGLKANNVRQISMGMSAGAFNTREFFHGMSQGFVDNVKSIARIAGFALPLVFLLIAQVTGLAACIWIAAVIQLLGLLADRWLFFAQARHPQNLYYQRVA